MLKVLGYFFLSLSIIIYTVSSFTGLTEKIAIKKVRSNSFLKSDKYRYGDLYGMTYLPGYRKPLDDKSTVPLIQCNPTRRIQLYAICDSYLYNLAADKKFYCGADNFSFVRIGHEERLNLRLDTAKNNVLLLEVSERSVRLILNDPNYLSSLIKPDESGNKEVEKTADKGLYTKVTDILFNKSINTNLELNTWDFSFFTFIKEIKAGLNYRLFNILDDNIAISPDNKYLLYKPTIDTSVWTSSFQFIHDAKLKQTIDGLNSFDSTAKSLGFKDIYLAIIPNPVSILYPDYNGLTYNKLLTRIQDAPGLKLRVVDIYSSFKNSEKIVYQRTDTHWNIDGCNIWLNKFNSILAGQ